MVLAGVFVVGLAAGSLLPRPAAAPFATHQPQLPAQAPAAPGNASAWKRAGNPQLRHPVEILRTIDGDTFLAISMAAGVTGKLWEMSDMVKVREDWEAQGE